MSRRDTCATCRYWDAIATDNERGQCRRQSPQWYPDSGGSIEAEWPQTQAEDWCGEYGYKMGQATEKARVDIAFPGLKTPEVTMPPWVKDAILLNTAPSPDFLFTMCGTPADYGLTS